MLTWRLFRTITVLLPAALALLSLISDPVRSWFVSRDDLRCFSTKDDGKNNQTIMIRNAGHERSSKISLILNFSTSNSEAVADLACYPLTGQPAQSFLDAVANPESLSSFGKTEPDILTPLLDEHMNKIKRTLYVVDHTLGEIRQRSIRQLKISAKVAEKFLKDPAAEHRAWIEECLARRADVVKKQTSRPECLMEGVQESWEQSTMRLHSAACKRWQELTGVELAFPSGGVCPKQSLSMTMDLSPGQTKTVETRYRPMALQVQPELRSHAGMKVIEVCKREDLDEAYPLFFSFYHPYLAGIGLLGVAFVIWSAWRMRPIKLRAAHEIFNLALLTKDTEVWETGLQNHRYYITWRLRSWCHLLGNDLDISTEQLLDFIRDRLSEQCETDKRAERSGTYTNEEELNKFIDWNLLVLVSVG